MIKIVTNFSTIITNTKKNLKNYHAVFHIKEKYTLNIKLSLIFKQFFKNSIFWLNINR